MSPSAHVSEERRAFTENCNSALQGLKRNEQIQGWNRGVRGELVKFLQSVKAPSLTGPGASQAYDPDKSLWSTHHVPLVEGGRNLVQGWYHVGILFSPGGSGGCYKVGLGLVPSRFKADSSVGSGWG